ncbi:MAG: hypothetical protein AAF492_08585, partial [Verrucomicrobiota bacterium]
AVTDHRASVRRRFTVSWVLMILAMAGLLAVAVMAFRAFEKDVDKYVQSSLKSLKGINLDEYLDYGKIRRKIGVTLWSKLPRPLVRVTSSMIRQVRKLYQKKS